MSTRYGRGLSAAQLRRNRQEILASDHEDADVIDAADDVDEDEDDMSEDQLEAMEDDEDEDEDSEDLEVMDDDEDDAEELDAMELMEALDEDDEDDDEDSDEDDEDEDEDLDDDDEDDDADDVDSMAIHGEDDEDDEDDEVDAESLSLAMDDDDEDSDAEDEEACGPMYAEDDDSDDDDDVTGGGMSMAMDDEDDEESDVSAEDEDSGDMVDDADDDDAASEESMTHAEDDDEDEDEDDDADDAEASPSGDTAREIDGLEPGVPAQTTFFGPPPDAGSSYAQYHCAGCGFEGMAAEPKGGATKADRNSMRRHVAHLADDADVSVELIRTAEGFNVRMTEGTPKRLKKLAKSVGGSYEVTGLNSQSFTVTGSAGAMYCPCCQTPMSVSAKIKTASLAGVQMDLHPVGRCRDHGVLYASGNDDTHVFCPICASETMSEGDSLVSVAVASMSDISSDERAMEKIEMQLHLAETQNPHWNVLYEGTPLARIELQSQDKPMELRELFTTAKYREATIGAMQRFGIGVALTTQKAHYYVAQANQAEQLKKASRRLKKASAKKLQAERDQYASNLFELIQIAAQAIDKNMFPEAGHPIKEAMADSLAEAGAHNPVAIVEDTFADGIFDSYVRNVLAKAQEFAELDPAELRGQIRMIQGATQQEPSTVRSASSGRTLGNRLARNSVAVRPSTQSKPARRAAATRKGRKEELKQKLNLGGASVR